MLEVTVIAGIIVALREIFGFLFNGRKKTIDYMAKKIIEHDAIKKPLELHEQRFNTIDIKIDEAQKEQRDCFLILLENSLRRYFYELKDDFNATIYKDCFLKIKAQYKAKGGNGIADEWDKFLKEKYADYLRGA